MKHQNPAMKRIRKSTILIVSCGNCKVDLIRYQKVGRGNLLRMYVERIIEANIPITPTTTQLICYNCHQELAARIWIRRRGIDAFKMHRATYNTRKE